MPRYAASISEMLTMPVGVLTTDYIDVWCNTATDTPHKICVGDMIAVKWNADMCMIVSIPGVPYLPLRTLHLMPS